MKKVIVAVVGATGLVGQTMIKVLEEQNFPVKEIRLYASLRSVGKSLKYNNEDVVVLPIEHLLQNPPDLALLSAGSTLSLQIGRVLADKGTWVIDNSSAWRMQAGVPLVVPEVNPESILASTRLIANPNCSTIQLMVALAPLHRVNPIRRLVISTYQSVSGSGTKAIQQMNDEEHDGCNDPVYPHQIHRNCLPHCDVFDDDGYSREETKLVNESRKILSEPNMAITATAVRVPVISGHSEAVNVEFSKDFDLTEIRELLSNEKGLILMDDPKANIYPTPLYAHHKDEVFVGRLRRDFSQENTLNMWIVSDNIRKGAATNTVQIAQYLLDSGLLT